MSEENESVGFGEKGKRSLLGISNVTEWIEEVNIGTVMHVEVISYEDSSFGSDIIYELSEKMLLEKVFIFRIIII